MKRKDYGIPMSVRQNNKAGGIDMYATESGGVVLIRNVFPRQLKIWGKRVAGCA